MYFYVKEWSNHTATLISEDGAVLWAFNSAEEAQEVCRESCRVQNGGIQYYLEENDFDPSASSCTVA